MGHTDAQPFHRPCSAYYASSVNDTNLCAACWRNGLGVGLAIMTSQIRTPVEALRNDTGQVVCTRVSVTKQYNLVLVKTRWCLATGKVTVGWRCAVMHHRFQRSIHLWAHDLERDEQPAYTLYRVSLWHTLLFDTINWRALGGMHIFTTPSLSSRCVNFTLIITHYSNYEIPWCRHHFPGLYSTYFPKFNENPFLTCCVIFPTRWQANI